MACKDHNFLRKTPNKILVQMLVKNNKTNMMYSMENAAHFDKS